MFVLKIIVLKNVFQKYKINVMLELVFIIIYKYLLGPFLQIINVGRITVDILSLEHKIKLKKLMYLNEFDFFFLNVTNVII